MNKQYILIIILLINSLFIYLFYRTEKTLINELFISLTSIQTYSSLKSAIVYEAPLNNLVIYSLPEGLWMFCITLTSKPYYIGLGRLRISGIYIPLIICLSLEMLQLLHFTNGRFDIMDVSTFLLFWFLGLYYPYEGVKKQNILTTFDMKTILCLVSYSIVYFAHVIE